MTCCSALQSSSETFAFAIEQEVRVPNGRGVVVAQLRTSGSADKFLVEVEGAEPDWLTAESISAIH
jgi:hypothetical protein